MQLNLLNLKCRRCLHKWVPRTAEVRVCPRCHSPYWDKGKGERQGQAKPNQGVMEEMVRRIVKACDPDRIILFGSHATGHAGPGSDVDLLVVTGKGETKRQQAGILYQALWDVGVSKDIVVVRPEEFERYRDVVGTVIYPAAREGRVLYERAA